MTFPRATRWYLPLLFAIAPGVAAFVGDLRLSRADLVVAGLLVLGLSAGGAFLGYPGGRRRGFLVILPAGTVMVALGIFGSLHRARARRLPAIEDYLPTRDAAEDHAFARLLESLRSRPPRDLRSLPAISEQAALATSEEVHSSVYRLLEFPPVSLPEVLTWSEDPLHDKTWSWCFHTTPFISALTDRFRAERDFRHLQKSEDLILGWIRANLLYLRAPASRFAWHDHGTALRLRAWLPFWEEWIRSPLSTSAEAELVLRAILAHGERLADPRFYTDSHNHGVEQDIALLAIGVALDVFPRVKDWISTATERLLRQIDLTVSPRGVHREHSLGYHVFMLGILTEAYDFAKKHGLALAEGEVPQLLARMARITAYLMQPDGRVPQVGDTTWDPPLDLTMPLLARWAATDPVLRFALSRGREGEPGEDSLILAEDGYAYLRDGWPRAPDYEQALHLTFTAAANPGCAHKQADDLSFTLFARGREWVVDPGHFGYDETEEGRKYVVHSRAHNAVVVDGQGAMGFSARIEAQDVRLGFAALAASHRNIPGFRHRRTILHAKPTTIFIVDELVRLAPGVASSGAWSGVSDEASAGTAPGISAGTSSGTSSGGSSGTPAGAASESSFVRDAAEALPRQHEFTLLFHLAPDLDVRVAEGGTRVLAAGSSKSIPPPTSKPQVLRLTALLAGRGSARLILGASNPLQGWISREHRKLQPAPVVEFTSRGEEAVFGTIIELTGEGEASSRGAGLDPEASITGDAALPACEVTRDAIRFRWKEGGTSRSATILRKDGFRIEATTPAFPPGSVDASGAGSGSGAAAAAAAGDSTAAEPASTPAPSEGPR